jgi:hypothetical protein
MSDDGGAADDYYNFENLIGGSLMKDLLADLAVDETDWLNLEQLERELSSIEQTSSTKFSTKTTVTQQQQQKQRQSEGQPPVTAASMIVQSQAAAAAASHHLDAMITEESSASSSLDAWSLSLQKFTAASLQEDFLQADNERKKQTAVTSMPRTPGLLDQAQDYDTTERPVLQPPPGIMLDSSQKVIRQAADRLAEELDHGALSKIHEDREHHGEEDDDNGTKTPVPISGKPPKPSPITPQNTVSLAPTPQPTPVVAKPVGSIQMIPTAEIGVPLLPPVPPPPPPSVATEMVSPAMAAPMMAPIVPNPPAVTAWQGTPPPLPRVYANPHPAAPCIPTEVLQSRYMKTRNISYVVHSILKPVLSAPPESCSTYHLDFWMRHHPIKPPPATTTGGARRNQKLDNKLERELQARAKKAQEWSEEHKTLGITAKSNVTRPRALIAVSAPIRSGNDDDTNEDDKIKQRATLWKARIYCDQGYQAYLSILSAWKTQSTSAQPHLAKIFKCLGMSVHTTVEGETASHKYAVENPAALGLLLKLSKGKLLLARIFENAILPIAAVQVVLPSALEILCAVEPSSSEDSADNRVFVAASTVYQTLPQVSNQCILDSVAAILRQHSAALSSTARMQCTHALLQRGSNNASLDPAFADVWKKTEDEFMNILSGS